MVLDAFASYLQSMLTEMATEEVHMLLGVSTEIDKMNDKLKDLKYFLADADRRNITDKSVQKWVAQLKLAMYEAADILDLCQLRAMEQGPSTRDLGCFNPLLFCMRNPAHAHNIGTRIKALNEKLDTIKNRSAAFSFINLGSYEHRNTRVHASHSGIRNRETSGEFDRLGVVGEKIKEDTRAIVDIMLTEKEGNTNIMVVAIVGVGGIGKTTLAQMVFKDEIINAEFDKTIWLSVNQNFDKVDLIKKIITLAGGEYGGGTALAMLQPILTTTVKGKKLFIVMDDVWSSTACGDMLGRHLANVVARGSRILITTRDERVARGMKAMRPYHRVNKLEEDDGWSLLKNQIVSCETDGHEIDTLKDIGLQIVAKCDGLPLAIKVLGGLLCQKEKTHHEWKMVLDDSIWSVNEMPEELNHAIYLSYEDLSSCIKQCLLYYSLLPKSAVFGEDDIIGMWIGEGFLHGTSDNLEELGTKCYKELIVRNLIEPDAKYVDQSVCSMHDVVRSFAQFVSRDEALATHSGETNIGTIEDGDWCSLEELGPLYQLTKIRLGGLENVTVPSSAAKATLAGKVHLTTLGLSWHSRLRDDGKIKEEDIVSQEEQQKTEKVFDELCPPPNLDILSITGYFGRRLPTWMMSSSVAPLKFLRFLMIEDLACCTLLPDGLCQLPYLEFIQINRAPAIKRIGHEFLQSNHHQSLVPSNVAVAFPRVHEMNLLRMVEWEDWEWVEAVQAFPVLRDLGLQHCKLTSLPPGLSSQARALNKLVMQYVQGLTYVENFASLVRLKVGALPELERINNLPRLQILDIERCPKLNVVEGVDVLQTLFLKDEDMETLPKYMGGTLSCFEDAQRFKSVFKMTRRTFNYICSMVLGRSMEDMNSYTFINGRVLCSEDRVAVALIRLYSSEPSETLGSSLGVYESTMKLVTDRFIAAMCKGALRHICWPDSSKMDKIKSRFGKIHNMQNCCGVICTTHIPFGPTCNHEEDNNILMRVIVDPEMRFMEIWLEWEGSMNWSSNLQGYDIFKYYEKGIVLNGSKLKVASDGSEVGEYIIGDAGYPLLPWLLTPYQEEDLSDSKAEFNRRHSAATTCATKALARFQDTWKFLQGQTSCAGNVETLAEAIYVCCMLHNIVIDMENGAAMPSFGKRNYCEEVRQVADEDAVRARDMLSQYFWASMTSASGVGPVDAEDTGVVSSGSGDKGKEQEVQTRTAEEERQC
ncbi:hypothetical protein ACQ4PT_005618 [Festuca glaucescens]